MLVARLLMLSLAVLQPPVLLAVCPGPAPMERPAGSVEPSVAAAADDPASCGLPCNGLPSASTRGEATEPDGACGTSTLPHRAPAGCRTATPPGEPDCCGADHHPPMKAEVSTCGPSGPDASTIELNDLTLVLAPARPMKLGAARAPAPSSTPLRAWTCVRTT